MVENKRRPPVKFTPAVQAKFLTELASTGNVTYSAHKVKMSRRYMHEYRDAKDEKGNSKHPEFCAAWDDAIEISIDILEQEARRRAYEGIDKPVGFYQGISLQTVKQYSNTLLVFLLKALRPKKYMERKELSTGEDFNITVIIDEG